MPACYLGGLLEFTLRRALFGIILPPDLQDVIDRITEFLTREKARAEGEIVMRQEAGELLDEGIEATQAQFDRILPLLETAAEVVDRYDALVESGEGILGVSTDTARRPASSLVLALE